MIKCRNAAVDNAFTEGFGVSFSGPSTLCVTAGSLIIQDEVHSYEGFEFDIDASNEFDTIYDVYLLEDCSVHVDRTEMAADTLAFYEGTEPIRHTLMSFIVPAATKDFSTLKITVNNLGGDLGENQSES